jgi:hypothetical protein
MAEVDDVRRQVQAIIARSPLSAIEGRQERTVFENRFVRIRNDDVWFHHSQSRGTFLRILPAVSASPAVIVVAERADGSVALVIHYRYPIGKWSVEFPRGTTNVPDADWRHVAASELLDETGLAARDFVALGTVYSDTGLLAHGMTIVLATDSVQRKAARVERSESIGGMIFASPECVQRLIDDGDISCGLTICAWYKFRRHLMSA